MPTPQHSDTCQPSLPPIVAGKPVKGPKKPKDMKRVYVSFRLNFALSKELLLASRCLKRPPSQLIKQLAEASLRERIRARVERACL
jgi:hypothetical protein